MNVTQEEYANALATIFEYRKERDLDFYLPINMSKVDGSITMEEFQMFLHLQKQLT